MFRTLHYIYVVGWVSVVLVGMVWLYPRTGIAEPMADWYDVWQNNRGVPGKSVDTLSGTVVKVMGPTSIALRAANQQWYAIGLLGVVPPPKSHARTEHEVLEKAQSELTSLLLSNQVEVTVVSMDAQHRGLGIVQLGSTNVNALMVQSGLLQLRREFIKGIPMMDQYALIRAERKGRGLSQSAPE